MNLTEELNQLKQQIQQQLPDDVKATMSQVAKDLVNSAIADRAVNVGDSAPNFTLPNAVGETVALQDLLQSGPVAISFYRGGWCPYCNLELRALQQALPQIRELGATLVTISPQTPDNSLSTAEKHNLEFEVLSDVGNQVAKQYRLVFELPESLRPIYEQMGIDLPAHNGDESFELPIPATYVVNSDGKIARAFVDADYKNRLDPQEIVAALRGLSVTTA
jgi:peroxiredoxin